MIAIMLLYVCMAGTDDCRHLAAGQMSTFECIATSQAVGAAWVELNPGMTVEGVVCADPKDLHKYIGWDI